MQSLYPDLPQVNPEELAELRTLGQITDHMGASLQAGQTEITLVVPDNGEWLFLLSLSTRGFAARLGRF